MEYTDAIQLPRQMSSSSETSTSIKAPSSLASYSALSVISGASKAF